MTLNNDVLGADVDFLLRLAKESHPDDTALIHGLERLLRALREGSHERPESVRPRITEDVREAW
jgi:hypothetical protein